MMDLPSQDSLSEGLNLARSERSMRGAQDGHAEGIQRRAWSPAMLDVSEAAQMLGIGRTLAYELVRTNRWPTPVIRVGRLIKIPYEPLREFVSTGFAPMTEAG